MTLRVNREHSLQNPAITVFSHTLQQQSGLPRTSSLTSLGKCCSAEHFSVVRKTVIKSLKTAEGLFQVITFFPILPLLPLVFGLSQWSAPNRNKFVDSIRMLACVIVSIASLPIAIVSLPIALGSAILWGISHQINKSLSNESISTK